MSRIRLIMLSLLAVSAVGAVASASASATICVKTAVAGKGNFDSSCVTNEAPTANQYIKITKLEKRLAAGEWCAKVAEAGKGEFEKNTCEGAAGTKEFIKVLAPEPQWRTAGFFNLNTFAETRLVTSTNVLAAGVTSTFKLAGAVKIECKKVKNTGTLIGGNPGTDISLVYFEECSVEGKTVAECGAKGLKPLAAANAGEVIVAVKTVLVFRKGASESFTEALDAFVAEGESANKNLFVEFELTGTNCGTLNGTKVKVEAAGTEITEPAFKRKCGLLAEVGEITAAGVFKTTASGVEVTKGGINLPAAAIAEGELWEPNPKVFKVIKCELKAAGAAATESGTEKQETVGPEAFGWEQ